MATDIEAIIKNIEALYDFAGKSVIDVGAGGGQFVGYAGSTRRVLAVDPDGGAVERLESAVRQRGLEDRFTVLHADFMTVSARADVALFGFCLHEIADPRAALEHARTLAPETLVADHAPGSKWTWYMREADKVRRSWEAAEGFRLAVDGTFSGTQRFHDYDELFAKVGTLGEPVIRRIEEFRDRRNFTIDMPYRVALLAG